mmetsp:Transcript_93529/g.242107  ORF Transcript_93529/g.242107 Transcript_93529/m.242107 type:complete len:267 (-) Transcript_93529:1383-2183(-)
MTTIAELQQHVDILLVLVGSVQLDDEITVDHRQDVALQSHLPGRLCLHHEAFGQPLERILLASALCEEHGAESTFSQKRDNLQRRQRNVQLFVAPVRQALEVLVNIQHNAWVVTSLRVDARQESQQNLSLDTEACQAFRACIHRALRSFFAAQDFTLAEARSSSEGSKLLYSSLTRSAHRLLGDNAVALLDDVQHWIWLCIALLQNSLPGLELEHTRRGPSDLPPLRPDKPIEHMDVVEEHVVLLQQRALSAKDLLELPAADCIDH